jgi:hypothetical protein
VGAVTSRKTSFEPDIDWIRARKNLLKQVKDEVSRRLGEEPDDLRDYRLRYEKEFRRRWRVSGKAELVAAIASTNIVYGGDFHASGQAQRTHLRILRDLPSSRSVILALECFPRTAQKWLDHYVDGQITLHELKVRTRWARSWGFPWEHYFPLFELAKARKFRLLALNESPSSVHHVSLRIREENAAECLRRGYERSPDDLIYVIFGDLHLADSHLPQRVRRGFAKAKSLRHLVIHLNSERIYFQLATKGLEHQVDVVRLAPDRFCVMNSPPWVQWQSYLFFLERTNDHDRNLEDETSKSEGEFDPTDQVAALIRLVARDFGVNLKPNNFAVYSADDSQVWRSLEQNLKSQDRKIARAWLASGRSFYLPATGTAYLARATVNHAASLAGQYVHAELSHRKRTLWKMPEDFSALIWIEATAYFVSKLINHHRRAETLTDLKASLAISNPGDFGREAMKLAMDRLMSELILIRQGRKRELKVRPRQKSSYLEAARVLGGMMGERLYLAYRSRKMTKKEIVELLRCDVSHRGFERDYEKILLNLSRFPVSGATRSRRERL